MTLPPLLVNSLEPHPHRGSEPGHAFHWTLALAKFFKVHVLCVPWVIEDCQASGRCDDWVFHPLPSPPIQKGMLNFYRFYYRWCKNVIPLAQQVIAQEGCIGLHHSSLGSFRMLPRYDKLPCPYTLGPLGGGEFAPSTFIASASLPPLITLEELSRPWINQISILTPSNRTVLQHAAQILAHTPQSAQLLSQASHQTVPYLFPHALDVSSHSHPKFRAQQMPQLAEKVQLIFAGRALWWKGGHIALELLKHLRDQGIPASLKIFSEGPALHSWQKISRSLHLEAHVMWHPFISYQALQTEYQQAHLFVYPTLHDSGSNAILEAYASGLPTLTLGMGGPSFIASDATGFNEHHATLALWLQAASKKIAHWHEEPQEWFKATQAAFIRSQVFSVSRLEETIKTHLIPVFS